MKLTKAQMDALKFYKLDFAKSGEPGAGWFAYTTKNTPRDYPLSSCECMEDVEELYIKAIQEATP